MSAARLAGRTAEAWLRAGACARRHGDDHDRHHVNHEHAGVREVRCAAPAIGSWVGQAGPAYLTSWTKHAYDRYDVSDLCPWIGDVGVRGSPGVVSGRLHRGAINLPEQPT